MCNSQYLADDNTEFVIYRLSNCRYVFNRYRFIAKEIVTITFSASQNLLLALYVIDLFSGLLIKK